MIWDFFGQDRTKICTSADLPNSILLKQVHQPFHFNRFLTDSLKRAIMCQLKAKGGLTFMSALTIIHDHLFCRQTHCHAV